MTVQERLQKAAAGMPPHECWEWPGARTEKGYGQIRVAGKTQRVHRVAFEACHGRPAEGLVRHSCDNPPCFNPTHLLDGTPRQNTDDMVQRGRLVKGEDLPQAILTEEDVLELRRLAIEGSRYGLHHSTVSNIATGKTWKGVG